MKYKPMTAINHLVVHCSATRATADVDAAEIRLWHKRQGWTDIGYHYVIKRDGTLEKGRPDDQPGAHVYGYNSKSLGICMVGGVDASGKRGENNFTPAQFATLKTLLTTLSARYPNAKVLGHRDLSPDRNGDGKITRDEWLKECPSFNAIDWWAANRPA